MQVLISAVTLRPLNDLVHSTQTDEFDPLPQFPSSKLAQHALLPLLAQPRLRAWHYTAHNHTQRVWKYNNGRTIITHESLKFETHTTTTTVLKSSVLLQAPRYIAGAEKDNPDQAAHYTLT